MNRCIKCGREIPDGELFCIECSLNPGSSLFEEPKPQPSPKGRMQTPQPVKRPAPQPVAVARPEKKQASNVRLKVSLALVSCLLVAVLAFVGWQYGDIKVERTRLETKEADMLLREKEAEELRQQLDEVQAQIATLNEVIDQKDRDIKELQSKLSGSQSSQSQSQYDLTTAQAELERLEEENEQLLLLEEDLRVQIDDLNETIDLLDEALEEAQDYKTKSDFMDSYVVFVENNNSGIYHTYDCEKFTKSNFWAYSRKLAERNGYDPCPTCGGKP